MEYLKELHTLYNELPTVNCLGCGRCCVSPTCTLVEFLYLFDYLCNTFSKESIADYCQLPHTPHPDFEGNLRCIFLNQSRCMVHKARTAACRIFGMQSMSKLGIKDLEECPNKITVEHEKGVKWLKRWLDRLSSINSQLFAFNQEPYYVRGMTINCWLDLYFDRSISIDPFCQIREIMYQFVDLSFIKNYVPRSGLKDKIDEITLLSFLLESGSQVELTSLLLSIRDNHPFAHTYFYEESQEYLRELGSIEKASS